MHSAVKLVIGLIILVLGLYWYAAPMLGHLGLQNALGENTFRALVTVFSGLFGLVLIFFGLVVSWIEYEDLKWEAKEKKEAQMQPVQEPAAETKKGRKSKQ